MINFALGPVMIHNQIRKIGSFELPYFRTSTFSKIVIENDYYIKKFLNCDKKSSKIITLTSSGTGAMEASVINTLSKKDKILLINGGTFGQRFAEILKTYNFKFSEIKCILGKTLTKKQLYKFNNKGYTSLLVNLDETSTGVLYDINLISKFCKENHLFTIVDSISSFLCDPYDISKLGINLTIISSQKALAIPPGLSFICLDQEAIDRIKNNKNPCYYFNLEKYLKDNERGQTPFTPAIGTILQLNKRLKMINKKGGVKTEIENTKNLSSYFRKKLLKKKIPFKFFANKMSNALTSLTPCNKNISAYKVFEILKNKYNIIVCPNGGELKNKVFRVGHIGNINTKDIDKLIKALKDMQRKNLI